MYNSLFYYSHNLTYCISFVYEIHVSIFYYMYDYITFILSNHYLLQGFTQFSLFLFIWIMCKTIAINNICVKKIIFLHSYIILLYMYVKEYYFSK